MQPICTVTEPPCRLITESCAVKTQLAPALFLSRILPLAISTAIAMGEATEKYGLAMSLFQKLCEEQKENFVFSPLSIGTAFAMLCAGANGTTETELLQFLGHKEPSILHEKYGSFISNEELPFKIANKCLSQKASEPSKDLVEFLKKTYAAEAESVDFAANGPLIEGQVNKWVSDKTNGMIDKLLSPGTLTPATVFVLLNAVYFKGTWFKDFEIIPYELDFKLRDGRTVKKQFMKHASKKIQYHETETLRFAKIPYKEADCYMVVAIPKEDGKLIDEVISKVDSIEMDTIISHLNRSQNPKVILTMPKFKIEFNHNDLKTHMGKLGVGGIFSPNDADFTKLFPNVPVYVSEIIHKAVIEVDEKGTVAAAATAVVMMRCAMRPITRDIIMTLDRPFYFAIHEGLTDTASFQGICYDPIF